MGGHTAGWGSATWNGGIKNIDGFLGAIFNAVDYAPEAIKNRVAIVLTADHGGGGGGSGPGTNPAANHGDASSRLNYSIPVFVWGPGIPPGSDAYKLFQNRSNPDAARPGTAAATAQPLRNADTANIAMSLLGLPPVEGSWYKPAFLQELTSTSALGNVTLSWPSHLKGYRLQTAPELNSGSWVDEAALPVEFGGQLMMKIPQETNRKFWRLVPPQ